jgi:lipoate-protein ligase A
VRLALVDTAPQDAALDAAISRALLERVAAGELPPTARLARPGAVVAFGRRDAVDPRYGAAVEAARAAGFDAVERLAGGRAALFHPETIVFGLAVAEADPRPRIAARFEAAAALMANALRRLGVDARVGEVPGEYCPGAHSVNARGAVKLAGFGQRVIAGGAYTGGVLVVDGADRVRDGLVPVYAALGLGWEPATAGSVADEAGASWDEVADALVAELEARHPVERVELDADTLSLAERLAPEHRPGARLATPN